SRSPIHKWGVFANADIGANEFIVEYLGELMTNLVADKLYERREDTYLFSVAPDWVIDATRKGNIAFINHSCDPNC
ncbi:hypothetical protein B0H13DRAFT_1514397, partial [Mycena leptocephala]